MHVAIYVRVSTQEQKQHGISVGAQETACREWVQEHGHHLAGVYNDAGLSARAKYTKRRAMLQLIEDIQAGKVELIIFTKLDRWFRNVADYYEVQAILEQHGVKWRAIQEDYETETASGRFKVNIMLAVAQDEADRTSERIKSAADYKRAKGEAVGRAPIGYIIKDKRFEIDPKTEPAMRAFFDAYLKTFRVTDAQNAMLEHGYRSGFDLDDIAQKAAALGMIPIEEAKTIQVTVTMPLEQKEPTWWEEVVWFFDGLIE